MEEKAEEQYQDEAEIPYGQEQAQQNKPTHLMNLEQDRENHGLEQDRFTDPEYVTDYVAGTQQPEHAHPEAQHLYKTQYDGA